MPPSDDRRDSPALRQEGPQQDASMDGLIKMARCQHTKRGGGNDYILCDDCGLMWDYRKESPSDGLVNYIKLQPMSASRTAPAPPQEGLDLAPIKFQCAEGYEDMPHTALTHVEALIAEVERHRARIQVLETSVAYLRYLVDHPVTQEQK